MDVTQLRGSITALITPFANGKLDEKSYQDFIAWQIKEGTDAVVPCGTTGESPTVSHEENVRLIELCVEVAKGKKPVIAGCGSNATEEAISLTKNAERVGADAALHVVPYYNKPTQEGLYQHYKAIHDATNIPILLYNVPARTITDLSVETVTRLSKLPRIVGIKDATSDVTRPVRMRALCGKNFRILSGDDTNALAFLVQGAQGCISVTSNIAPALCTQMQKAWASDDVATAQKINDILTPLHNALFCETSPGPIKYAASLLGLCKYELRLPMVPIAKTSEKIVEEALQNAGLLTSGIEKKVARI
jgi:4-hydroxy-tetrahydrodipicolinate synthase